MFTPFNLVKRAALFPGLMLWAFSVYSAPIIIATPPIHAYTISGTVSSVKNPPPGSLMPSLMSPVPGCTVTVTYDTVFGPGDMIPAIAPPPTRKLAIFHGVTDNNGRYSVTINAVTSSTATISAAKAGVGASTPASVSLTKDTTTVNLTLQDVVVIPPPAQGTATLQGMVFWQPSMPVCPAGTACPQVMPMPQAVPQCTVTVAPMMVPMIYPTPVQYLPKTAVTDADGHYSLSLLSGDYIVTAQKSGLGSAQANATLTAGQTTTLNLTLAAKDTTPVPPVGKASVEGTVKEIINPPNPAMGMASTIQPVPGCTVMVCAAVLPIIYNQGSGSVPGAAGPTGIGTTLTTLDAPAVLIAQQYIAITDANGHYSFKDIPVYGNTYSVSLMAKKGNKFGSTQADLIAGQTVTADIIIGQVVVSPLTDSTIGVDQQYYDAVAKTLSTQKTTAVSTPLLSSSSAAAAVGVHVSGNSLFINLPSSRRLTVRAFALNGKLIATLADNRLFSAGEQAVSSMTGNSGPMLIQIQGENVSSIVKVNSMRQR